MNIKDYKVEKLMGFNINRASIILRKKLTFLLKSEGINITPEEFAIISRLWEDEGIQQNLLVERTLKDKTRVTRLLNNLENKTYVYREINKNDKRKQSVFLTKAGRELKSIIVPIILDLMGQAAKGISPEELEITQTVLKRIFLNLNEG